MKKTIKLGLISVILLFIASPCMVSCGRKKKEEPVKVEKPKVIVPEFNADSAWYFVKTQVDFGPRVPETAPHEACAAYLSATLRRFCDTVQMQPFRAHTFDNKQLNCTNIIGSFNPRSKSRILLCAHWDSRPFADYDPDPSKFYTPIDGANDGASGVGVLLEIARQMSASRPKTGIDIIFFDAEDYGEPKNHQAEGQSDTWGLGSQHWSKNPHVPYYSARYGILLDMVGAADATFLMESVSMYFAPGIMKKVWTTAGRIGYGSYFIFEESGEILDDHYYINTLRGVPTIDIIHIDHNSSNKSFFEHWHTTHDKIDKIDRQTLKAVGQTVLTVVYEDM